eukprot:TRINITY_DN4411_c0_g1_i1.p2 TRINITY_DN4411_c0_g1~~TRINITY_DN4411_c0_g1_i1.p2  ORF type:complete len:245 (+),score=56.46 TRINITY_DN4411_c0_g1_i1:124-858(+)
MCIRDRYMGKLNFLKNQKFTQQMAEQKKRCTRNGCRQQYLEAENIENCCKFHPGKPIFHDLKKGWTCCNKIVYDWDEFEQIPPCATGLHTDVKQDDGSEFFQSNTVSNAQKALENQGTKQVVKSIDDYNKEEELKKKKLQEEEAKKEKKLFINAKGFCKCLNKGCNKDFKEEENNDQACHYHPGEPIFHDVKKFWTCCKAESYDWDDFMQLPTCTVGKHQPKYCLLYTSPSPRDRQKSRMPSSA